MSVFCWVCVVRLGGEGGGIILDPKPMQQIDPIEDLLELISGCLNIGRDHLSDDKSLFHDFGVAGVDGYDLLKEISEKFDIDMSQVCWVKYFGEEQAYNPFFHLCRLLQGRRLDEGIARLKISDLKQTVATGRWVEPRS